MSLLKKSFTIGNHRTSISLEQEFWDALEIKAKEQDVSLSKLVLKIDNEKPKDYNNLSFLHKDLGFKKNRLINKFW